MTEYRITLQCVETINCRSFTVERYIGFMDFAEILLLVGTLTRKIELAGAKVIEQQVQKVELKEVFSWRSSEPPY